MAGSSVAELVCPIAQRRSARLTLQRPSGQLGGVSIDLFIRAGLESAPEFVGEVPTGVFAPVEVEVPARLLKAAAETFVEASFVIKQPAGMSGTIRFRGELRMGEQAAAAAATVTLAIGDVAGLADLTWWVVQA